MNRTVFFVQIQHVLKLFRRIRSGIEVWHRANSRISAMRSCHAARFNRFLVRETRFAIMNVNVYQTWGNQKS